LFTLFWTIILFFQKISKKFTIIKSNEDDSGMVEIYFKDIAFLFIISILYSSFLELIGFEILTFIFLFSLLINRMDLSFKKSFFYSSILSCISMFIFWLVFIIFLRIPFPLKFLPFLIY
jgi:hypothetical protein